MRQVALGAAIALGLAAGAAGYPHQVEPASPPITWIVLIDDLHWTSAPPVNSARC
jgi:hypothetical protein